MSVVVDASAALQPRPAPCGLIVTRTDIDELGYCARGARRWAARMGLSWPDFVARGIDAEILRATGDAMALRLVDHVMSRTRPERAES